uniref:CKLF factor n=1 Tax=Otus sunia TaxID=257818 RepID=A0A8C8AB82_9STRI
FVAFLCFAASRAPGAYTALAGLEALSAALLLLLYLLQLDARTGRFFWPLADVFNSVISALFLLVVCLFAVIIKTNNGTLAGGVITCICFHNLKRWVGESIALLELPSLVTLFKKKCLQSC